MHRATSIWPCLLRNMDNQSWSGEQLALLLADYDQLIYIPHPGCWMLASCTSTLVIKT